MSGLGARTGCVFCNCDRAVVMPVPAYNLITATGSEATQTIPHFHVHLVPRLAGDGLTLPWTGQVKP